MDLRLRVGQLGHGDEADKLLLTLVAAERFEGDTIVMVAAGMCHSVALGADGRVWTWGWSFGGCLGHNNEEGRLVPTHLGGALAGAAAVLVAAGSSNSLAVTIDGVLWAWGSGGGQVHGGGGQLGLGDGDDRLVPARVGGEETLGSRVLTVACGYAHTLCVTEEGTLWTFGNGCDGVLGHNDANNRLLPTQVEAQYFGHAKIVSAAAGSDAAIALSYSAVVTEHGHLYTWGSGTAEDVSFDEFPSGLGHSDGQPKLVPTLVAPHLLQFARIEHCHGWPRWSPLHALAFAMGTHSRLGISAESAPAGGGRASQSGSQGAGGCRQQHGLRVCCNARGAGAAGSCGMWSQIMARGASGEVGGGGATVWRRYAE